MGGMHETALIGQSRCSLPPFGRTRVNGTYGPEAMKFTPDRVIPARRASAQPNGAEQAPRRSGGHDRLAEVVMDARGSPSALFMRACPVSEAPTVSNCEPEGRPAGLLCRPVGI